MRVIKQNRKSPGHQTGRVGQRARGGGILAHCFCMLCVLRAHAGVDPFN